MQESGEMYLETILVLGKTQPQIHAIDIVKSIGYSKAAVSRALTRLKNEECILVDDSSHVKLTDKGRDIAEKIYERHNVLSSLLVSLGVSHEVAISDACKLEHVISDSSFEAIKKHMQQQLL